MVLTLPKFGQSLPFSSQQPSGRPSRLPTPTMEGSATEKEDGKPSDKTTSDVASSPSGAQAIYTTSKPKFVRLHRAFPGHGGTDSSKLNSKSHTSRFAKDTGADDRPTTSSLESTYQNSNQRPQTNPLNSDTITQTRFGNNVDPIDRPTYQQEGAEDVLKSSKRKNSEVDDSEYKVKSLPNDVKRQRTSPSMPVSDDLSSSTVSVDANARSTSLKQPPVIYMGGCSPAKESLGDGEILRYLASSFGAARQVKELTLQLQNQKTEITDLTNKNTQNQHSLETLEAEGQEKSQIINAQAQIIEKLKAKLGKLAKSHETFVKDRDLMSSQFKLMKTEIEELALQREFFSKEYKRLSQLFHEGAREALKQRIHINSLIQSEGHVRELQETISMLRNDLAHKYGLLAEERDRSLTWEKRLDAANTRYKNLKEALGKSFDSISCKLDHLASSAKDHFASQSKHEAESSLAIFTVINQLKEASQDGRGEVRIIQQMINDVKESFSIELNLLKNGTRFHHLELCRMKESILSELEGKQLVANRTHDKETFLHALNSRLEKLIKNLEEPRDNTQSQRDQVIQLQAEQRNLIHKSDTLSREVASLEQAHQMKTSELDTLNLKCQNMSEKLENSRLSETISQNQVKLLEQSALSHKALVATLQSDKALFMKHVDELHTQLRQRDEECRLVRLERRDQQTTTTDDATHQEPLYSRQGDTRTVDSIVQNHINEETGKQRLRLRLNLVEKAERESGHNQQKEVLDPVLSAEQRVSDDTTQSTAIPGRKRKPLSTIGQAIKPVESSNQSGRGRNVRRTTRKTSK